MKKILFITPIFGRTGSEMILWYLLNHLDPKEYRIYLFSEQMGELLNKLPPHVKTAVSYRNSKVWYLKLFRGILKMFGIHPVGYQLSRLQKKFKADLWYVNTITVPGSYGAAKKSNVKIVTHFHELLQAYNLIRYNNLKDVISISDVCIGCSEEVCDRVLDLGHRDVRLQYSFIDAAGIKPDLNRVGELRRDLGINPGDFVWIISGTISYMKGLDQIIPVLEHFKGQSVKIIWIGGKLDTGLQYYAEQIVAEKYKNQLFFPGGQSADYYNYMELADGMLILSREESFSLVAVEAVYLGKPVVGFNTGILGQIINEENGALSNTMDINAVISGMHIFHERPVIDLEKSRQNVLKYTSEFQLPHFERLLNELLM
ncbi:hypothetical protein DBR11_21815 [Pedobacter sp. HMWF019]|nr:hypothetical protein DBR11_21815 [Pedobacter sp. HMWF019]